MRSFGGLKRDRNRGTAEGSDEVEDSHFQTFTSDSPKSGLGSNDDSSTSLLTENLIQHPIQIAAPLFAQLIGPIADRWLL